MIPDMRGGGGGGGAIDNVKNVEKNSLFQRL